MRSIEVSTLNIQLLQELKPYSAQDLQQIFQAQSDELDEIIQKLINFRLLRRITRDFSRLELEDLLGERILSELDWGVYNNSYVFKFVGMISINATFLVVYPKYMKSYFLDKNNGYKDIRQIIEVIHKYQYKAFQNQFVCDTNNNENFSFLALVLELIQDYWSHGLYHKEKQSFEDNGMGEVHWGKTIFEQNVYMINNEPLYLNYYTVKQTSDEGNFLRRLHCSILADACELSKDMLTILGIPPLSLTSDTPQDLGERDYLIYKIERGLNQEFITVKQNMLKRMLKYLKCIDNRSVSNELSFIGTNSFNLVWEDVCAAVLGDCKNKPLVELGYPSFDSNKTLLSMIKKPLWHHNESKTNHEAKDTLIPDIIVLEDNKLYIYDAKYYTMTLTESEVRKSPGVGDISKQHLYELAYREFAIKNNVKIMKNAFIMPTDENKEFSIGTVKLPIFESLCVLFQEKFSIHDIEVIFKPARQMYEKYLKN